MQGYKPDYGNYSLQHILEEAATFPKYQHDNLTLSMTTTNESKSLQTRKERLELTVEIGEETIPGCQNDNVKPKVNSKRGHGEGNWRD